MKEDECLNSQDGIKFVVCNQWGIFNIRPVVQFAIAQGYNVVEYNRHCPKFCVNGNRIQL